MFSAWVYLSGKGSSTRLVLASSKWQAAVCCENHRISGFSYWNLLHVVENLEKVATNTQVGTICSINLKRRRKTGNRQTNRQSTVITPRAHARRALTSTPTKRQGKFVNQSNGTLSGIVWKEIAKGVSYVVEFNISFATTPNRSSWTPSSSITRAGMGWSGC